MPVCYISEGEQLDEFCRADWDFAYTYILTNVYQEFLQRCEQRQKSIKTTHKSSSEITASAEMEVRVNIVFMRVQKFSFPV